ncbi:MAG: Undecaprenyl phosphate-alpha-4-amino-4-deoxy-L-arabinose arabinosyl transferase [Thermoanaerobaculia bacterium]|nr:Undecaprenyl phosphate-alpha-4-amino-4-deoxy-L-arabinose arabinosyl transferase [Thermoanaerobaculia bacterium]
MPDPLAPEKERGERRRAGLLLTLILAGTFGILVHNLDHTALWRWDESFHAVVAQNVLENPLRPALIADPYLPYDYRVWWLNSVWLHKPILTFWQIALSFGLLGVSTFALRLPSALMATGAVFFTYAIGKRLFDRKTALLAAALQAVNPFVVAVVQGYQFVDHVDAALLFWVEAGLYFLIRSLDTGSRLGVVVAGVCQGLAFLAKSALSAIIFGVALAAWFLPILGLCERSTCRLTWRRVLALPVISFAVSAPWLLYCWLHYPAEFAWENWHVWLHVHSSIENWGAPWDRLIFDYLIAIHGHLYTPAIVAMVVLAGKAVASRHRGLWLGFSWALGVIVPLTFAVTKTPSATLIALPPVLLLLSHFVLQALRNRGWLLASLSGVLVMSLLVPAVIRRTGQGPSRPPVFGGVMREAMWVPAHVAGAAVLSLFFCALWLFLTRRGRENGAVSSRGLETAGIAVSGLLLATLGSRQLLDSWRVTERNLEDPVSLELGLYAREKLPKNAVLLCEVRSEYEHMPILFYSNRTSYAMEWRSVERLAERVRRAGGIPFIVSPRDLLLPAVFRYRGKGTAIYRLDPEPGTR